MIISLTTKDLETILKNEMYYKNILNTHFLEKNNIESLGVQNNTFGNSFENSLLKDIENDLYNRAYIYIKSINETYNILSERQKIVYEYRFRYKFTVEVISFKINYSTDTIWRDIRLIKKFLKKNIYKNYKNNRV